MRSFSLVPLVLVVGCSGGKNPADACTVPELGVGEGLGTIEDKTWTPTEITWTWAGDDVQINAPRTDGWQLSMVAMTDMDGVAVKDKMDGEEFPVHVALGAEGGGIATLYPEDGGSYTSSNGAGGDLQLLRLDMDYGLVACFSFEAGGSDGSLVTLTDGAVRAMPM